MPTKGVFGEKHRRTFCRNTPMIHLCRRNKSTYWRRWICQWGQGYWLVEKRWWKWYLGVGDYVEADGCELCMWFNGQEVTTVKPKKRGNKEKYRGGRRRRRKWGCVGTVTSTHCITSLHMSMQHIGRWGIPQCDKNVFGLGEVVKWQVVACATLETRCSSSLRLSWPTLTKIVCVNYFSCVSYIHDISTRLRPSYGSQMYWVAQGWPAMQQRHLHLRNILTWMRPWTQTNRGTGAS